jgi:hypothetical protein
MKLNATLLVAYLSCCSAWAATAIQLADSPRMEICLNGAWDTIVNASGGTIPTTGWSPRRAPAMPIATDPPTTSIWYKLPISISRQWQKPDRHFILRVEKAGHYAAVYWNGRMMGEHYGQYTPFEADVTSAERAGANEIAIFVHNASGKYARPGIELTDPMQGNAYRGATNRDFERNWVGITGDIFLAWRPAAHIADVFVVPSVRTHELEARIEAAGATGLILRADVLDEGKVVVRLPVKSISGDGAVALKAAWSNPVLWGPEPYGKPKLYTLRTELSRHGELVDRRFTRFGFREVWVEGRDVLLNGKKLWMAGTYFAKLAPIRYLNDRRPQSRMIEAMQAGGLNTSYGHWDELGGAWLDQCDEMGMLVLGAFFCDGRPLIQSKADAGWVDWMADTCSTWVRADRNHPSIVMWRPTDVLPQNIQKDAFNPRLAERVRKEDGTRPIADDSDIAAWSQSPLRDLRVPKNGYDDGSRMASALAASTKPLLTKEIYGGFADLENMSRFFRSFYEKSYAGGGAGILVQHMPMIQSVVATTRIPVPWLSESGMGNRDTTITGLNWYGSNQPAWTSGPYGELFAELQKKFQKQTPAPYRGQTAPELLVSGLAPDDVAILMPPDRTLAEPVGTRAASDGTAWIIAPGVGAYRLFHREGSKPIRIQPRSFPSKPGYEYVERFNIK